MLMPPDLVIFDCDGVLVDSEPVTNRVMQKSFANYGLSLSLEDVMAHFVGGTMQGVKEMACKMGASLPEGWIDEIYVEMFQALEEECEPIEGALDALAALDASGIPYAVGSNGPHAKMEITLRQCGLLDRLKGRIFSREDVSKPKPSPDVYLHAAAILGAGAERCVVVEDSPTGAQAGVSAGMYTLGFAGHGNHNKLASVCDSVFTHMAELPRLLSVE